MSIPARYFFSTRVGDSPVEIGWQRRASSRRSGRKEQADSTPPTRRLLDAEEMKRDPDGHADDDADHHAGEEEALDLPIDLGKNFDRRFLVRERWDDAHELSLVHVRGWAIERLWLSVVNQSRVSGSNVQR